MIGFEVSFTALHGEHTILVEHSPGDCDGKDHPILGTFGTLPIALLTMFQYMLGEVSFEEFYNRFENVRERLRWRRS